MKFPITTKDLVIDVQSWLQGSGDSQFRMFFSSGTAQTKGGADFCMITYSLASWGRNAASSVQCGEAEEIG